MAEFVQLRLEESVVELQTLRNSSVFTKEEIDTIVNRRREFEYKLRRRTKCENDFLGFATYETKLLALVELRRKRMRVEKIITLPSSRKRHENNNFSTSGNRGDDEGPGHVIHQSLRWRRLVEKFKKYALPEGEAERSIVIRINSIYREAVKRYPRAMTIWKCRLDFAKSRVEVMGKIEFYLRTTSHNSSYRGDGKKRKHQQQEQQLIKVCKRLGRAEDRVTDIYNELMSLHSGQVWVWIGAAEWVSHRDFTDIAKVRTILRKALDIFSNSPNHHNTAGGVPRGSSEISYCPPEATSSATTTNLVSIWLTYLRLESEYYERIENRSTLLLLSSDGGEADTLNCSVPKESRCNVIQIIFRHASETLVNLDPEIYRKLYEVILPFTHVRRMMEIYVKDRLLPAITGVMEEPGDKIIGLCYLFSRFGRSLNSSKNEDYVTPSKFCDALRYLNENLKTPLRSSPLNSGDENKNVTLGLTLPVLKFIDTQIVDIRNHEVVSYSSKMLSSFHEVLYDTLSILLYDRLLKFNSTQDHPVTNVIQITPQVESCKRFVRITCNYYLDISRAIININPNDKNYNVNYLLDYTSKLDRLIQDAFAHVLEIFPGESVFWEYFLKIDIHHAATNKSRSFSQILATFDRAISKVKERDSCQLWLMVLEEAAIYLDAFLEISTRALTEVTHPEVLNPIKTFLFEHWCDRLGYESAIQHFYDKCLKTRPYSWELLLTIIRKCSTHTAILSGPTLLILSHVFRLALQEYGPIEPDVWIENMKYVRRLHTEEGRKGGARGDFGAVDELYKLALKTLEPSKVETFLAFYVSNNF